MKQTIVQFLNEFGESLIVLIILVSILTMIIKIIKRYASYTKYVETEKSEQLINPFNNSSTEAHKLDRDIQYYMSTIILISLSCLTIYYFIKFFSQFLESIF